MEYRQCVRCVMDTSAKEITFDANGVCNFCRECEEYLNKTIFRPLDTRTKELRESVERLKQLGKNDKYDCLIGLSGGVDSSYICYWAKQEGLRPLIVHFDNGWNSELAVKNIENIINKLGFDLYTYVIDWESFKDLQLSYIKASVIDIEAITDQLIFASIYKIAKQFKIKTIVDGVNNSSESILPKSWIQADKLDYVNLRNIHRKFGTVPLKNFPKLDLINQFIYSKLHKLNKIQPLNLIDYNKDQAKEFLKKEFDWKDYGGKHYESVFTRFYQGYILNRKFGVDKRKAHLSSLIVAGQLTRKQALEELEKPAYSEDQLRTDYEFVIKKFGLTKEEFEIYMNQTPVEHSFYGTQWDEKEFRKYYIFKKISSPFFKTLDLFRKK
jgi:N-acetyl sugar amidotransferase